MKKLFITFCSLFIITGCGTSTPQSTEIEIPEIVTMDEQEVMPEVEIVEVGQAVDELQRKIVSSETLLKVRDVSQFSVGQVIRIQYELMLIQKIDPQNSELEVVRGHQETEASAYAFEPIFTISN